MEGVFFRQKKKGCVEGRAFMSFWTIWKARNKISFEDAKLSIRKLKSSFVHFLLAKTTLCIKEGTTTLIEFIEWLGSK